jgi:sialate O-acetylesterase
MSPHCRRRGQRVRALLSWLVAAVAAAPLPAASALRLAAVFSEGAVLQRDRPIPIWGWSEPQAKVQVRFHEREVNATAGTDGRWLATLPARPASATPSVLFVQAGAETRAIADVLVGDVWLCSGQSNMEWTVAQSANAEREIAAAQYPLIRQFRVARAPAVSPAADVRGDWKPAIPAHVGGFTGVGFFFARDLHRTLGVPIGLLNASWGGKMIEVFLSAEAIARSPHAAAIERRWIAERDELTARLPAHAAALASWDTARAAALARGEKFTRQKPTDPAGVRDQHLPSCAYNAMIAPLSPYGLRGILWYQGEHNVTRAQEYRALCGGLIADWREKFAQADLPFYFVQIANYRAPTDRSGVAWAELREAQAQTLTVPHTGMAVTIDIGTPDNTHPPNKQDVGVRLARLAKAQTYGLGGEWSGPTFRTARRAGAELRVEFDHRAAGLVAKEDPLPGFEVAGTDGRFHPATATLRDDIVLVRSAAVVEPVAVRYAWANAPQVALFNSEGLPAAPFRCVLP